MRHGALSSLSDRVKIARDAQWPDVVLSVQEVAGATKVEFTPDPELDDPEDPDGDDDDDDDEDPELKDDEDAEVGCCCCQ